MKFLADENIDQQIVLYLRSKGHNVYYIAETDAGISDDDALYKANVTGALLLTGDKDFGELVFRLRRITGGVVLIRLAGLLPLQKAEIVEAAINKHGLELLHSFSVITKGSIRIRHEIAELRDE